MAPRATLLKALLRERHWQKYATFCKQYDCAATRVDEALIGSWPSRAQLARWMAGDLKGLPHPDHCRVLAAMFPGLTVKQLFAPSHTALPASTGGVDATIAPTLVTTCEGLSSTPEPGPLAGALPVIPEQRRPLDALMNPIHSNDAAAGHSPAPTGVPVIPTAQPAVPGAQPTVFASLGEEIGAATHESARFVRRLRGAVSQEVLDQLDGDVRHLASDYLTRPAAQSYHAIARLRHEVFGMLDDRQRPRVLPGLYRVAGRLCALLAHAAGDLGQTYAANTDARAAWLCAELSEDDWLRAFVRWLQSNMAYWSGDYRRAAELAHNGQRHAGAGTTLLRLASQEARSLAAIGDREVERALMTAAAAAERPGCSDEAGVFAFGPAKVAYYASESRLAIGGQANHRRAAADAQTALDLLDSVPDADRCPEFVAAARLDLVAACAVRDELEAADEQMAAVFSLPMESRTLPVTRRAGKIAKLVRGPRFAGSPPASALTERIAVFCSRPAPTEQPMLAP